MFLLSALALLLIPGPAVLYIVGRSIHQGRKAGFASVFGIAGRSLVHVAAAALGHSALLLASTLAFSVVRYAGAAYLVYLGLHTLFVDTSPENRTQRARTSLGESWLRA
jgi:threonine/homoserine/homoserine lactone efflux protein